MPGIDIVLVEPLHEGNVGAVARVMKNFGYENLVLVDPCPIGEEAIARSAHARDVLDRAEHRTLDEVFSRSALTVATTGEVGLSVCRSVRMPYFTPRELRPHIEDIGGTISFLFGRENFGLSNEEIARSDLICTIPTSPAYPILNLSHAVAIVCYECAYLQKGEYLLASREEMEALYRHFDLFLDEIDHPDHKRQNTLLLLRRIFGRARLTAREASTLHGLLRRTEWHIRPAGPDDSWAERREDDGE